MAIFVDEKLILILIFCRRKKITGKEKFKENWQTWK